MEEIPVGVTEKENHRKLGKWPKDLCMEAERLYWVRWTLDLPFMYSLDVIFMEPIFVLAQH